MIYGAAQAGDNTDLGLNLTALIPGEGMTLFDGTETPEEGLASVAFARGYSPSASDNGTSFFASGMAATTVVDIEASNVDDDALYTQVGQIGADMNGNGAFTDVGRAAFYRAKLSAYTTGDMPTVTAQR